MSMSCLMVHWFEHLANQGALRPGDSYFDLGPQELTAPRAVVTAVAKRLQGEERGAKLADAIFHGQDIVAIQPESLYQYHFMNIFSLGAYESLDLLDEVAEYRYDLNHPFPFFRSYDIVANFGTAEHVFRAANVFEFCHRVAKPTGLMLHVLPAFGDINHGFFNIHPILYLKLAAQNNYEIIDIQYIDDIALRSMQAMHTPEERFDFSALPVQIGASLNDSDLKSLVASRFVESSNRRAELTESERNLPVFDYCFTALRRRGDSDFVVPSQYGDGPIPRSFNWNSFLRNAPRLGRYR